MINQPTISLEDMPIGFDGHVVLPTICEACYQGIHHERRARSTPQSYAALAVSKYIYQVVDWSGLASSRCHCCNSTTYSSRYKAELVRR